MGELLVFSYATDSKNICSKYISYAAYLHFSIVNISNRAS